MRLRIEKILYTLVGFSSLQKGILINATIVEKSATENKFAAIILIITTVDDVFKFKKITRIVRLTKRQNNEILNINLGLLMFMNQEISKETIIVIPPNTAGIIPNATSTPLSSSAARGMMSAARDSQDSQAEREKNLTITLITGSANITNEM